MSLTVAARQPAGSPVGGQFAPISRTESDLDIASPATPPEMPSQDEMAILRDRARAVHREARRRLDEATLGLLCAKVTSTCPQARTVTAQLADTSDGHTVLGATLQDGNGRPVDLRVDTETAIIELLDDIDIDDFANRLCHSWRGPGREAEIGVMPPGDDTLSIDLHAGTSYLLGRTGQHR